MCRIIRVPAVLDTGFGPLRPHWHWHHGRYFRRLVVAMALTWGRRHGANLYRYLAVAHHRTRFPNFCLVARWDPEAALRQQAQARLCSCRPGRGEPLDLVMDDSKTATRGQARDAVAKMQDPTTEVDIRGPQDVCAILVYRDHVMPWGIRLSVKKAPGPTLGVPFHKTTALAAPRIREFQPAAGVQVVGLFDAYDLGPTVVQACREQPLPFAAPLKSHRSLFTRGWQLTAGRYGRHRCRRRRPGSLDRAKPYGPVRSRFVAAGWREVSTLGPLPVVFSRQGPATKILGLVTDTPERSAADVSRTDDKRWTIAPWRKDVKQLLGLGHDQHRSYGAAVTHRPLVCFASALLTHLRIEPTGAHGHRTRHKAAELSTATAQAQLRRLRWEDLMTYLTEGRHGQSVIEELERRRVA